MYVAGLHRITLDIPARPVHLEHPSRRGWEGGRGAEGARGGGEKSEVLHNAIQHVRICSIGQEQPSQGGHRQPRQPDSHTSRKLPAQWMWVRCVVLDNGFEPWIRFCGGAEGTQKGGNGGSELVSPGGKDSRHWVELPSLGKSCRSRFSSPLSSPVWPLLSRANLPLAPERAQIGQSLFSSAGARLG